MFSSDRKATIYDNMYRLNIGAFPAMQTRKPNGSHGSQGAHNLPHVGTIGIITNDPAGIFQQAVIAGAQAAAESQGYDIVIFSSAIDPRCATELLPEYDALTGVLAIANAASDFVLSSLRRSGKPISLVSHRAQDSAIPVVTTSNSQGIAELVKHLIVGCKRHELAFIRGIPDQVDACERETAFRHEMLRYGYHVPESRFFRGEFAAGVAAESVAAAIQRGERFDGLIASDYIMSIAATQTLRAAGIDVPGTVSVVGFGDDKAAETFGLTTAAAGVTELGACAARQLIAQIRGLQISGVTTLSVRLMIRETCGFHRSL